MLDVIFIITIAIVLFIVIYDLIQYVSRGKTKPVKVITARDIIEMKERENNLRK
jgi:hypothetical protein